MNAASFVRVSKKTQRFERQFSDLDKLAERNGYKVIAKISEKISGIKDPQERNGISELLKLARSGKIQMILTTEVSRIGRDPLENLKFLTEMHKLKIAIHSQDIGFPTLNDEGKPSMVGEILYTVFSGLARQEREKLMERIESGIEEARKRGVRLGRPEGAMTNKALLKKYTKVVAHLGVGTSIRNTAMICNVSKSTVERIKRILDKKNKDT